MKKFKAIVNVGLKPTIKDIKSATLKDAVSHLLDIENFSCKVGSRYILEFEAKNKIDAENKVKIIADEILANSVIEEYEILWEVLDEQS